MLSSDYIGSLLIEAFDAKFSAMLSEFTEIIGSASNAQGICNDILRSVIISHIDEEWKIHLVDMDLLRSEVGLRSVGQKDPLIEFKNESFLLFEGLIRDIRIAIVKHLFALELSLTRSDRPDNAIPTVATAFHNHDNFRPMELTIIGENEAS